MAFSATTEWDVRSTGSDGNGGGFDPASTGTDYSQQNAAQVTYTDLVIDGTTNTKCTSAGNPFTSAHVGNIINITSGTGFTVQRVQVVSVVGSTATCDKSLGTLSSTGGNGVLGGGLLTLATAKGLVVAANTVHIKAATYTFTAIAWDLNSTAFQCKFSGYQTTHYDNSTTRPLLTTATNSIKLFKIGGATTAYSFENINFSNTAGTRDDCFYAHYGDSALILRNCILDGFRYGVYGDWGVDQTFGALLCMGVEIKNAVNDGVLNTAGGTFMGCYLHDNGAAGFTDGGNAGGAAFLGFACIFIRCTITNNVSHGVYDSRGSAAGVTRNVFAFFGCTVAKNGGDGFKTTVVLVPGQASSGTTIGVLGFVGNVFALNTGIGVNVPAGFSWYIEALNAIYSNTGGNTVPYKTTAAITLTGDPFTNSGSKDYTLNNTAGAGASLRNVGIPQLAVGSMTDYSCVGGLQPQVVAGGGLMVHQDMQGGCTG